MTVRRLVAQPYIAAGTGSGHGTRRCVVAKAGDEIANPRTGQRMVFLETGEHADWSPK
jgi:hypothetical protein